MDFLFKHKTKIALALGLLFILYGIAGAIFKFNVRNSVSDNVSFVLMVSVFYLYFGGRNRNTRATKTEQQKDNIDKISGQTPVEDVDINDKEVQNEVNKNTENESKIDKE